MEVAYLALSVVGMVVAVSLSIRDEKRRDREISQCLAELTCFSEASPLPGQRRP